MLDFEKEDYEESRLEAYQRQIAERKQNKAFEVIPYSTRDFSNENEICAEQELSVEQLNLKFSVDDKIDSICLIDKEYQDTLKLVKESEERAQKAKEAANKASNLSAGFGKKRKAIEALQNAQKENSLANEANSQAITKINMLQKRIIEATRALFTLGISNVAANRSVYRQLELKFKGVSEQELSDFAKNEVFAVMQQLNEQQDMMAKYNKLSEEMHEQGAAIEILKKNQEAESKKHEEQIQVLIAQFDKSQKKVDSESDENGVDTKRFFTDDAKKEVTEPQKEKKKRWFRKKH